MCQIHKGQFLSPGNIGFVFVRGIHTQGMNYGVIVHSLSTVSAPNVKCPSTCLYRYRHVNGPNPWEPSGASLATFLDTYIQSSLPAQYCVQQIAQLSPITIITQSVNVNSFSGNRALYTVWFKHSKF